MSKLQPHRFQSQDWHLIADEAGRPMGHYKAPSALLREQVSVVREFLKRVSKQKGERAMSDDKNEKTNMVFLAGKLKFDPKSYESNTRALIDVGLKACIQVSVYYGEGHSNNKPIADKLKQFKEGDFIKLVATLRPYGTKNDNTGEWKNNLSIDITQIKNEAPKREARQGRMSDDDVPF